MRTTKRAQFESTLLNILLWLAVIGLVIAFIAIYVVKKGIGGMPGADFVP